MVEGGGGESEVVGGGGDGWESRPQTGWHEAQSTWQLRRQESGQYRSWW